MSRFRPLAKPLDRPIRLGVLISGGGTTLTNLLQRRERGELDAEFPLVIANRPDCAGIDRARAAGLNVHVVERRGFDNVEAFSGRIFELCREAQVDLVVMAGFLSLVRVPDDFRARVMNIHPGLIPAFCGKGYFGLRVHAAAIERGVKVSGCTVHFADNEYDHGPIVLQKTVPVLDDDTPEALAARVFAAECEAYPEAIRLFAAARLEVEDRRVRVRP